MVHTIKVTYYFIINKDNLPAQMAQKKA